MATRLRETLDRKGILVMDGAWGTVLQTKGWEPGTCPESLNAEKPDMILKLVRDYIEAGADIVETNSFGGSLFKLAHYGKEADAATLNRKAAELSRQAAGKDIFVAGSVGPTGKLLLMGDVTKEALYASYSMQAEALLAGGADFICVESMQDIEEAEIAVKAAKASGASDIMASFAFEPTVQGDFKTMMGVTPSQAAEAMAEVGATILGANCGKGFNGMEKVIKELKDSVPGMPVAFYPNAGLPKRINGVDVFEASPGDMAANALSWRNAGASIIGGCCGTTPDHIRAISKALKSRTAA